MPAYRLLAGTLLPLRSLLDDQLRMTVACGVHSEMGRLRNVLVCRPGLAQKRLTPANYRDLVFDDVLWVAQARNVLTPARS
jgi:hypothetical protein